MQSVGSRYDFVQQLSGLSKTAFADSLGISKVMAHHHSRGAVNPSISVMESMSRIYGVNLHWLITGEGSPRHIADTVSIPLYDLEAAAGSGREAQDHPESSAISLPASLLRPHRAENLACVYIDGDSMSGEGINHGDIVVFSTLLREIKENGVYIVSMGATALCKRVEFDREEQAIILVSANPAYEPRRVSGADLEDLRIVGRVVYCIHRV